MSNKAVKLLLGLVFISLGNQSMANAASDRTAQPEVTSTTEVNNQNSTQIPNVKYPAALIFEGGKGYPGFYGSLTTYTPMWRLYICFEKTDQPLSRQFTIDLAQLGTPIIHELLDSVGREVLYRAGLNSIVLNYTYTAAISDSPTYLHGSAAVDLLSQQNWEVLIQSTRPSFFSEARHDVELFNRGVGDSNVMVYSSMLFQLNDAEHYVSRRLDKFAYDKRDNNAHIIEACERANQPYVLMVGDEVTSTPQSPVRP